MAFFGIVAGPNVGEHVAADILVEIAHAVYFLASFAAEGAHAELFAFVVWVGTSQSHEVVPRNAQAVLISAKVASEEAFFKIVVAGWNGGMHGVER